jgi:uncharacterized membrane protein YdfJ with MMPL/SSD domain
MGRRLYRLGRFCAAHPRSVVLIWLLFAIAVVGTLSVLGSMTNNNLTLPGTESQSATNLLAAKFPPQQNGSNPIVFHVTKGKVTDKANKQAIESSYKALTKEPNVYSAPDPFGNSASGLVSANGQTAFIPVLLSISNGQVNETVADRILSATKPARRQGIEVAAGGQLGTVLSASKTESSEVVGLATAMVILAITFGSLIAMGLPIVTAITGLALALGAIGLLSRVFTIPVVGPTLATMIGLGVGIDYSLFLIMRYREQRSEGVEHREAIARSVATAGSAIVFAGTTVVIALVALAVAGIPLVSALGFVTALAVITAVLAAISFLPAVLSLLGGRVFGAPLPRFLRRDAATEGGGMWAAWASRVTRHPALFALLAVAILIPLIIPVTSLHLGQEDVGVSPRGSTEREAFDLMSKGFGPGYNGPLLLAVSLKPDAKPSQTYEQQYKQAKQLQADLDETKKSLTDQANALKAKQADLLKRKQQLEAQESELRRQQAALLAQQQQLLQERSQLLAERAALPAQRAQLESERARLKAQRLALQPQIRALVAQQARLRAAVRVAAAAVQRSEDAITAHDCAAHSRRVVCRGLQAALQRAQAAATSAQDALDGNAQQVQRLKNEAAEWLEQARELAHQVAGFIGEALALAQRAYALQQQAAQLQQQAAALQQQAAALQQQADQLQREADQLQAQSNALKQQQHDALLEQRKAIALKQQLTDELTYAGGDDRGTDPRLVALENALATPAGVLRVGAPKLNKQGDAATYTVIPTTRPADIRTADLVNQVRNSVLPAVLHSHPGMTAYLGGVTAANVDLASKISAKLAEVIAVVLVLSFLLLMVAFRSLVIPLQAALTNLLCVAAAFGVLTATFQWGWGLSLVGLPSPTGIVPIASYVPLMMFAALFGLSMDYEVFLVSQIAQHHGDGTDPRTAIRQGVAGSAKVIAAAALIMIAVFASFILNPDPTVKQFGVGLAVAVFLAGTMVLLLAPALLSLLSRFLWSMPRVLDRMLPRIDIEGEHAIPDDPVPEPWEPDTGAEAPSDGETSAPGDGAPPPLATGGTS